MGQAEEADLLVVPGGAKGAETISGNKEVQNLVRRQVLEKDKYVGMICAGASLVSLYLWILA